MKTSNLRLSAPLIGLLLLCTSHAEAQRHPCLFSFQTRLLAFCLMMTCCFALHAQTDTDGDGLKEIWTLTDLDNIRNDLKGSYELMQDLDFTDTEATGYNPDWDPVVQKAKAEADRSAGWPPIGDDSDSYYDD